MNILHLEMKSDLDQLISAPREDLAVEYKTWMDLTQEVNKATLAKACIALANHGGGFLILGFEEQEEELESIPRPTDIKRVTQDGINSAVRRYAEPAFHCQLHLVKHKSTGVDHPIITVPGNVSVPVMSKRAYEGGIHQHRCYIRKSGPRSEEPQTEQEWRTLLGRCVLANREDLLSSIRSVVLGHVEAESVTPISKNQFEDFRGSSFERWQTLINTLPTDSQGRLPDGYYTVSIHPVGSTPTNSLNELNERLAHARRITYSGWPPFWDHYQWMPDAIEDHIEAWAGTRTDGNFPQEPQFCDYWRASRSGQLFTVRGYTEDSLSEYGNVRTGEIVDINMPIWRIGEVLYFAARHLGEFENVQSVLINCQFTGLSGRTISCISPNPIRQSRPCRSSEVTTEASATLQQLQENMVEIVHELLVPFYEVFGFFQLSRRLVEENLARLRR